MTLADVPLTVQPWYRRLAEANQRCLDAHAAYRLACRERDQARDGVLLAEAFARGEYAASSRGPWRVA